MRPELITTSPPNPQNPFLVLESEKIDRAVKNELIPVAAPVGEIKKVRQAVDEERPYVLVTTATPEEGAAALRQSGKVESATVVRYQVTKALWDQGLVPLFVAAGTPPDIWKAWLSISSGIVIPGGADWNPRFYGEKPHPTTKPGSIERDELELELINYAFDTETPLLGICRGFQGIVIAAGGNIFQNLADLGNVFVNHYQNPQDYNLLRKRSTHHDVSFGESSPYFHLGSPSLPSMHHQGVIPSHRLEQILFLNASSRDGILEGLTDGSGRIIGLQSHVEAFSTSRSAKERQLVREFMAPFTQAVLGFQIEKDL